MKFLTLTISLLFLAEYSFAQYTITGRVINQADTRPLVNANVFLSNTTIGNPTAADGAFILSNLKPGKYELVISCVGFETYNKTVTVNNSNIDLQTITIFPKSIAISAVTIKAKKGGDSDRPRYLEWFKAEFLGTLTLARECKILNPELLDFNYDGATNTLTASSIDFLIIKNDALGYKIKYLLKNFMLNFAEDQSHIFSYSGIVQFEAMKGSPEEEKQWLQSRQEVYENSQMHFLRSALSGTLAQDGFRVLRVPANPQRPADSIVQEKLSIYRALKNDKAFRDSLKYWQKKADLPKLLDKVTPGPLKKEDFIKGPDKQGIYNLNFNGDAFFITYNKNHYFNRSARSTLSDAENKDNTLISFDHDKLLFDKNGTVLNPDGLVYDGIWMRDRISGLLPLNYETHESNLAVVDSALVKKIIEKVTVYTANHVTEKAYLHFDKPYYAAGDTMYFKAYVTEGQDHQPSKLSGVLYADLINEKGGICNSIKMHIVGGVAWGDFALPHNLSAGNYRVRAYTQWMRNDGGSAFFDKTMPIGSTIISSNIAESGVLNQKSAVAKADIKFFPEGGSLVAGVRSKLAFKAIGPSGLGVDVKGVVLDNENNEIATFSSTHLGMGYLFLTPSETKTYTAKVSYAGGAQEVIELPKADINEIGFAFTDINRAFAVKISAGKQWYRQNKDKNYTLVIYSGGVPQSFTTKLESPEINLDIVKNNLRTGVATATLFSANGEPLCERLLFVQGDDLLNLSINTERKSYEERTATGIKLNVINGAGNPVPGHFSVAVVDESRVPVDENSEPTIINNLLLTSDLKGYVEQPGYYFTNRTRKTEADLDLVMLTHGYRKFEWERIFGNTAPLVYQPEKGLSITGHVNLSGKPVQNGKVKLFSKAAGGLMLDTLSDANGRFVFDNLTFDDTTKFVVQARTAKGQKDIEVKPDTNSMQPVIALKNAPGTKDNGSLAAYVQKSKQFFDEQDKYGYHKNGYMLKEVVIKDKKTIQFEHSQNLNGKGNADQVITADWLETAGYSNLYDAVRAKAVSIHFLPDHRLRSNRTIVSFDPKIPPDYMLIVVDGIPQLDDKSTNNIPYSPLDGLDASQVESVEILLGTHGAAIYGSIASGGAVIVTTKTGRRINNYYKEAPGVITVKPIGFYKARQFYVPKYGHAASENTMKDLRTTIYWNPDIITDRDGNVSFSYFNADGKGSYRVVIEGMDIEGNLGRQVYRYKVE
ncbi:carboxypeptidase regulatory-like domain-containing protein [Mucilaginibacter xinganensis]|uniref:TonB-dependent receptor plug domain-containing protein n=1 Tax=Mucilaginibacter xinganensis TaxID=1234841 RepID=A0A223P2X0_9SPHI|nr:carboxypeptidase regulatory-like domain-containing protein [Mucilaginibacter xinganensis]ASU36489.1 hypothetical protein MuYL_4606 [Mucilaginibacter xinganensis]